MSLEEIVGKETYTVWVEMLRQLVPDGRTHRLAPLVAAMLQYASALAYEKYGGNPEEGSAATPCCCGPVQQATRRFWGPSPMR